MTHAAAHAPWRARAGDTHVAGRSGARSNIITIWLPRTPAVVFNLAASIRGAYYAPLLGLICGTSGGGPVHGHHTTTPSAKGGLSFFLGRPSAHHHSLMTVCFCLRRRLFVIPPPSFLLAQGLWVWSLDHPVSVGTGTSEETKEWFLLHGPSGRAVVHQGPYAMLDRGSCLPAGPAMRSPLVRFSGSIPLSCSPQTPAFRHPFRFP